MEGVDPGLPLEELSTGQDIISRQLRTSRLSTLLTVLFAGSATVLALVGILGVLSVVVAYRMRELGIRVALGASPRGIRRLVLARGMAPVIVGLFFGLVISIPGTRLLSSQLFGVGLRDPLAFIVPLLSLAMTGLLACQIPALRAQKADPVSLLKSE